MEVPYSEHHPSALPIAPYTTTRMSASLLTRLSRLTLQTPPRDPQCVVQDTPPGASDHDVLGFTPATLQSAAEVEPAEAVVISGSEQGVHGSAGLLLKDPLPHGEQADPSELIIAPDAQHSPVVAQSPESQGPPDP